MSTAEKLRAEGRIEGIAEGKIELLLRLAQRRFGPLSEDQARRLRFCSPDDLDAIGERLLDAQSLDEAIGG
jgi:hypothetical protein